MAKAFTAPFGSTTRGAFYQDPVAQASANLAGVGRGIIGSLAEENLAEQQKEIDSANRRQISEYQVAKEATRQGLKKYMRDNPNTPETWATDFQNNWQKTSDGLKSGVTMTDAKEITGLDIEETRAEWAGWITDAAAKQTDKNQITAFGVAREEFVNKTADYTGIEDVTERMIAWSEVVNSAGNLMTPEAELAEKREGHKRMLGDYLLQSTSTMSDEDAMANIDAANQLADSYGYDSLFGEDEIADLKKTHKAKSDAVKGAERKQREETALANDRIYTDLLEEGIFTMPGPDGKPVDIRDAILADPSFSGGQVRTLTSLYETRAKELGKGFKETALLEEERAYGSLTKATEYYKNGHMSYDDWRKVYAEHGPKLEKTERKQFMKLAHEVDEYDPWRKEAYDLAEKSLGSEFKLGDIAGSDDVLAQDEILRGKIMKPLDAFLQQTPPPSRAEYRVETRRVIRKVIAEEQAVPAEKPKRSWWTGRITVTTDAEYEALDSGTEFYDPDGTKREKP